MLSNAQLYRARVTLQGRLCYIGVTLWLFGRSYAGGVSVIQGKGGRFSSGKPGNQLFERMVGMGKGREEILTLMEAACSGLLRWLAGLRLPSFLEGRPQSHGASG